MDIATALADVAHILFPEHTDLRATLRLAAVCKQTRNAVMLLVREWAAFHCGKLQLHVVAPADVDLVQAHNYWHPKAGTPWLRQWMTQSDLFQHTATMRAVDAERVYQATAPSPDAAWVQLCTKLCRECFAPTTSVLRTSMGSTVRVCRRCYKDPRGYSSLVNRAHAHALAARIRRQPAWLYKFEIHYARKNLFWRPRRQCDSR
jgi:hypothetical protein